MAAGAASAQPQVQRVPRLRPRPHAAVLVDNYDWLAKLEVIPFLRDIGKHFPLSAMIAKESVRAPARATTASRTPSSATRCCRPTTSWPARAPRLHAPDGRQRPVGEHHRGHRADPRVRAAGVRPTLPLVTKADGAKFGKTESRDRLARPGERPRRTRSTSSGSTPPTPTSCAFLRYFTFLAPEEIDELAAARRSAPETARGAAGAGARGDRARPRRGRAAGPRRAISGPCSSGDLRR